MKALSQFSFLFVIVMLTGCGGVREKSHGSASQTPNNGSPQEEKKKTLTLYFTHEIDKKQATWLVRPYGLKIIKITEITPAVSFSISDTKQRRAQVEDLQSKEISQSIAEFIEIPPKIFVIPNSKNDLNEVMRALKRYDLQPTSDTYPSTAELSVDENEAEEWKTRLALDSGVAMVGEEGVLYATRNFDLPGPEYADLKMRLISASTHFSFIPFDPGILNLPGPRRSPPRPLIPHDLSEECMVSPNANLPNAIDTVVHRFFGGRPNEHFPEFISIQNADPELATYTIVGVKRLVTRHWEYYELIIEFNRTGRRVKLRGFIRGWGARAPSPPSEKSAYREDLEEETTQRDRLQSKLTELLGEIRREFCDVTQPRAANDHR
jgi:hypothetical protein